MALNQITEADLSGKGVIGLPDTPEMSASSMQQKLDELATDVIVPKFNAVVDALGGTGGAAEIGTSVGLSVQAELDLKAPAADVITKDNTAEYTPSAPYHPATKKYIDDIQIAAGAGDMVKAVYDPDGDGVVKDSDKLGGQPAAYYAKTSEVGTLTDDTDDTAPIVIPTDADTLGGHPPEYFAQAGQVITQKLLWTNASPGSAFAAQTLNVDLTGCDLFAVECTLQTNTEQRVFAIASVGKSAFILGMREGTTAVTRVANNAGITSIQIDSGWLGATTNTSMAIPQKIYGIKGVQS